MTPFKILFDIFKTEMFTIEFIMKRLKLNN